jgi:hypothetical protein
MFGLKRRAREREARIATANEVSHRELVAELVATIEWLILRHNLGGRANALLTKAEAVRRGIDSVLIDGLEAFGPELANEDEPVRAGGMVANGKRGLLLITGAFDRSEARGDFCYILGFTRDGTAMREQPSQKDLDAAAAYERGYQWGRESAHKIATAVDEMMERLVKPWADGVIDIFTKRVAVKVIFCDEDPAREARSSLAEFNQAVDDHLEQIRPDVRAKLSAYEQQSREVDALDEFEFLLKSRFDSLRHNLTVKAIEIARCVVSAREKEMGLDVEQGEHLTNGQRILEEARAMPVSLTEDQMKTLKTCLEALE